MPPARGCHDRGACPCNTRATQVARMTSTEQVWLLMAAAGVGTFAIRYSFVGFVKKSEVPRWAVNLLRHVPAAALTALVVTSMA